LGALVVLLAFWAVRLAMFFSGDGLSVIARDNLFSRLARVF
jgi:hypothetical protein